MTPPAIRHAFVASPLGRLMLVAHDDALARLSFPNPGYPKGDVGACIAAGEDDVLGRAADQLSEYFGGSRRSFDLPFVTHADEFAERVWSVALTVPYGETTTYGALASRLGDPLLAQRIGQALGRNPIGIVIPCHRVVGAGGALTGYAGGLERKRALLALEESEDTRATRLF